MRNALGWENIKLVYVYDPDVRKEIASRADSNANRLVTPICIFNGFACGLPWIPFGESEKANCILFCVR